MPTFWHRPALLWVAKIAPANRTKWEEPMRCGVMQGGGDAGRGVRVMREYTGLIPRSRKMRNQTKSRFSQEPNKKITNKSQQPDSNKSQKKDERPLTSGSATRRRPLEASIDDLPTVPGLLANPDVPTELVTRRGLSTSIIPLEQMQHDGNREEEEGGKRCGARD